MIRKNWTAIACLMKEEVPWVFEIVRGWLALGRCAILEMVVPIVQGRGLVCPSKALGLLANEEPVWRGGNPTSLQGS